MKIYKVELLSFYAEIFDSKSVEKKSKVKIQAKLDKYAAEGYKLISTNAASEGAVMHIYLYFEKDE
jgi:hypothetical protein